LDVVGPKVPYTWELHGRNNMLRGLKTTDKV
jgi:hypothetical protein